MLRHNPPDDPRHRNAPRDRGTGLDRRGDNSAARGSPPRGSAARGREARDSEARGSGATASIQRGTRGIFGFGLSHNKAMDLIIVIVVACIGIFIKFGLAEDTTRTGNAGPASSTIWAYGLTAIAVSIMVFMGIYQSQKMNFEDKNISIGTIVQNTFPIVATLSIVIYTMYLNFSFFTRINSDLVTKEFRTYSILSSVFLLLQIFCIAGYLFNYTTTSHTKTRQVLKSASYILCFINAIFLLMMHINLAFFSTDETN